MLSERILLSFKKSRNTIKAEHLLLQIEKVLLEYSEKFRVVAYLLAEDVERLVEGQGLTATLAIVGNKRRYTELCTHLKTGKRELWGNMSKILVMGIFNGPQFRRMAYCVLTKA